MHHDQTVLDLKSSLGFSEDLAAAYVRARGRCEYCGTDLLMSRQGYAAAELDHILPSSRYSVSGPPSNIVLACHTCNGVKGNWDALAIDETPELMLSENRQILLRRVRAYISREMARYDVEWRKATEILHKVWWDFPDDPKQ